MNLVRVGQLKMNPQSRGGEFMVMEGDLRVPASLMYRASDRDTFNVEANLGRQHQVVAVSSQRVLSQRDTGTLALTASPFGVGMQLGCIRQLYDRVRAELNWVLGPAEETGVVLNITRGSDNWSVSGKLQVLFLLYSQCIDMRGQYSHPPTCACDCIVLSRVLLHTTVVFPMDRYDPSLSTCFSADWSRPLG